MFYWFNVIAGLLKDIGCNCQEMAIIHTIGWAILPPLMLL